MLALLSQKYGLKLPYGTQHQSMDEPVMKPSVSCMIVFWVYEALVEPRSLSFHNLSHILLYYTNSQISSPTNRTSELLVANSYPYPATNISPLLFSLSRSLLNTTAIIPPPRQSILQPRSLNILIIEKTNRSPHLCHLFHLVNVPPTTTTRPPLTTPPNKPPPLLLPHITTTPSSSSQTVSIAYLHTYPRKPQPRSCISREPARDINGHCVSQMGNKEKKGKEKKKL